jgi:hypothetical protein
MLDTAVAGSSYQKEENDNKLRTTVWMIRMLQKISSPTTTLIAHKSENGISVEQTVRLQVVHSDGASSNEFKGTRAE